ncbi:MAG: alanine racemase [Acidimicrobiia bacterium]|nr:alanine racemase [Acidimicrobiia bacterium]
MRPSVVEVDLRAIRHNAATLAEAVAPAQLCAVVKADGYGHGDVPVAEAAVDGGATWLAVALVEEGVRLREAGIEAPILVLSEPALDDAAAIVHWRLTPTAYRTEFVEALDATGAPISVHVKVDTGMHRVGADTATAIEVAAAVSNAVNLRLGGLWTHFAVAEDDAEFTKRQTEDLIAVASRLKGAGMPPDMLHAANSAGALGYPQARLDMVRCGIALYGLRPGPGFDVDLQPAMTVKSKVSFTKRLPASARPSYGRVRPLLAESTVATVPIGYADGLARRLGVTGGEALIGGKRHAFAGTVTMDHIVVDCGDDQVSVGDEVVVLGRQGDEEITADEWATRLETINYEVVCDFGPRLPRRYLT